MATRIAPTLARRSSKDVHRRARRVRRMSHGTDTSDQTAAVREAVEAGADDLVRGLVEVAAHPVDLRRSGPPRRRTPLRRAPRPGLAGHRLPDRRGLADSGPARRVRRVAQRRPGGADRTGLRPPRRPARLRRWTCGSTRRSSRRCSGDRLLGSRCCRRQGPGLVPRHPWGCARISRRPAGPARPSTLKLHRRGRGGVGLAELRRAATRSQVRPAPLRRRRGVFDTGMSGRATPRPSAPGCAGMTDGQVDSAGPTGDVHSGSFGGAIP